MNSKKWLSGILAASMAAAVLAGCGGSNSGTGGSSGNTGSSGSSAKKELTVWSHLTPAEVAEVDKLAQAWANANGYKVTVLPDDTGFSEFAAAALAGAAPDIMYGLPHDNLGNFWMAGLLAEVPSGVINTADYQDVSIDAVSFDGKMYAVPVSMEAIGMFYNKAKVSEAPKTWDQFVSAADQHGFMFDVKNFYFAYGFIGGMGGYVFKAQDGALDATDVGFASEGGVKGLELLSSFVNDKKWMPADVNGDMAKAKFIDGSSAFYISGPWDIGGFKDAGVDYGVAPVPNLPNGQPFTPFVGVQAAFVAEDSKDKDAAWELVKYLNEKSPLILLETGNRIPVQKVLANSAEVQANADLSQFLLSAANGIPMPNIPAMSQVWEPAGKMIDLTITKQQTAEQAANDAVKAINDAVSMMK